MKKFWAEPQKSAKSEVLKREKLEDGVQFTIKVPPQQSKPLDSHFVEQSSISKSGELYLAEVFLEPSKLANSLSDLLRNLNTLATAHTQT